MADEVKLDIAGAYKAYTEDTVRRICEAEDDIAENVIKRHIVRTSPVMQYRYKTDDPRAKRPVPGAYRESWRIKTAKARKDGRYIKLIYNDRHGPLVHLIELGHNINRPARAHYSGIGKTPEGHVQAAQDTGIETLHEEIKKILGQ